jgi:hypothetical protein
VVHKVWHDLETILFYAFLLDFHETYCSVLSYRNSNHLNMTETQKCYGLNVTSNNNNNNKKSENDPLQYFCITQFQNHKFISTMKSVHNWQCHLACCCLAVFTWSTVYIQQSEMCSQISKQHFNANKQSFCRYRLKMKNMTYFNVLLWHQLKWLY